MKQGLSLLLAGLLITGKHRARLLFLSSANVFDAYSKYPSYEYDKTLSESIYGRLKIRIENMLLRLPARKMGILRLPMVFGNTSPRIREIKQALSGGEPIEVFPNLVLNVTSDDKLCQQIHYMINRGRHGIYHLGSRDLVHHDDFIREITTFQAGIHYQRRALPRCVAQGKPASKKSAT